MGRAPCCSKVGLHRGPWTPREDTLLVKYIEAHGEGHWRSLPKKAGLLRCGKSCRLRWMNYLRPDIKRGNITSDEDDLIIRLHSLLGNRWSLIAGRLPGRTDNEIKNYWNTHLSKRLLSQGTDPNTHKKLSETALLQRVKKRKNSRSSGASSSNKNQKNNKKNNKKGNKRTTTFVEPEKSKLHLPKPVRVTSSFSLPRNDSFDQCNTISTVSSSQGTGEGGFCTEVLQVPWSSEVNDDENGTGFLAAYNDENDFVNGSDFECQSHLPATDDDNSLKKLYEEYLQLLESNDDQGQLDSFAESLLV